MVTALDEYIKKTVACAPTLTEQQVNELRVLLFGHRTTVPVPTMEELIDWARHKPMTRPNRYIPKALRKKILESPCTYCGRRATQIDHIIPLSRGGTNAPINLAPACADCNFDKGDLLLDEWRAMLETKKVYRW